MATTTERTSLDAGRSPDAVASDRRRTADPGDEIAQLREALVTRTVIGQATGIIAGRLQVSTDTAWRILCRASTDTNHKVRLVAEVVVTTHDKHRPAPDDAVARAIAPIIGFRTD